MLDNSKLDESLSKNDKISVISQVTGKSESEIKSQFPNYDKDYVPTPEPKPDPKPEPKPDPDPIVEKTNIKTFLKKAASITDKNTSFIIETKPEIYKII